MSVETARSGMVLPAAQNSAAQNSAAPNSAVYDFTAYWVDACQRAVLTADTLRQRGNNYLQHMASKAPHVLTFQGQLVIDGRTLPRPVNYALVRITPPEGVVIDRRKRPFIVFDPRAGHGPGIGGMKQDSEIGVAMKAGHPCYFVGFLPDPMPGQTIEDVCVAEARFIEAVRDLEPDAVGKPCLIGNCQAGWQIMLTAAVRPDLPGPIILAGSPLSYWAGVRGRNPMRYLGGLLGGTWLTALSGDMGAGIFDGANLVANFESMNLANTYFQKAYTVYSKVDTEQARFLDFETWWGSPVLLNAGEMEWIADNLFVGNRLTQGTLSTSDGERIDLRTIRSPVIVFCSWGDDITPPQQALGWVLDLYDDVDELVAAGQTVVYTVHQTIGHLGIFVSGQVATKEHSEFASCIDMIDLLPPGLYEAVITEATEGTERADLVEGKYLLRLEPRTLDDIRAFGTNGPDDDLRFRTVDRVSEINKGLYRTFAAPLVRAAVTPGMAQAMRDAHPHRIRFSAMSDRNLGAKALGSVAQAVRDNRRPVAADNPFRQLEAVFADQIAFNLRMLGEMRDMMSEQVFLATYGNPVLQALVGLRSDAATDVRGSLRDVSRDAAARAARDDLEHGMETGDVVDAVLRATMYASNATVSGTDERIFATLKEIARLAPARLKVGPARFKAALRRQYLTLRLDEARALETLPRLLPADPVQRRIGLAVVRAFFDSRERTDEERRRLAQVERIFEPEPVGVVRRSPAA